MRSLIIILAILPVVLIFVAQNRAAAQASPPVLAFYYAWFDESTWTSGQAADTPSPTYRSADPATIERHVSQASSAGITAFVQSWYGPQVENNQTETNFRALLDIAAGHNFQAAVDVEVMGPFFPDRASVQGALATLMVTHVQHPAYLRYQGKPVIFFWRQQRFSVEEWVQIREAVDPARTTYWIAEGLDLSYQAVFDGHHLYSIAWAGDPYAELSKWPSQLSQVEAALGVDRLWVATAMPGYSDLNLSRANAFYRPRENGAYFRQTWAAAQATNPDMIIINSFNEWLEGSQVEPSATYGDLYLNLTRELTAQPGMVGEPAGATQPPGETPQTGNEPSPPAPEAAPYEGPTRDYSVQPGDTVYGIAERLGFGPQLIIALNSLKSPDRLSIGQLLLIPESPDEGDGFSEETEEGYETGAKEDGALPLLPPLSPASDPLPSGAF
jgi:LysM repeat protein